MATPDDLSNVLEFIDYVDREALNDKFGPSFRRLPPPTEQMLKEKPEVRAPAEEEPPKAGGAELDYPSNPMPPLNVKTREAPMVAGTPRSPVKNWNMVGIFFNIREQIKLYHWQTTSYAQHKTTDDLVKSLDENIDTFVEAYMGIYGRPSMGKTLPVKNLTSQGMKSYLRKTRTFLVKTLPSKIDAEDKDLLAIRDTILGDVDKAMYLFTLA